MNASLHSLVITVKIIFTAESVNIVWNVKMVKNVKSVKVELLNGEKIVKIVRIFYCKKCKVIYEDCECYPE